MPFVGKLGSTPRFILGQAFIRSAMLGTPAFMATKKGSSAPIVPAAHKYWRIKLLDDQAGDDWGSVTDLRLFNESNADITAHAVPTASSTFGGIHQAPAGVDGSTHTWWASSASTQHPHWFKLTFPNAVAISRIQHAAAATASQSGFEWKDWDLEYSDNDTDWHIAKSVRGEAAWTPDEVRSYDI